MAAIGAYSCDPALVPHVNRLGHRVMSSALTACLIGLLLSGCSFLGLGQYPEGYRVWPSPTLPVPVPPAMSQAIDVARREALQLSNGSVALQSAFVIDLDTWCGGPCAGGSGQGWGVTFLTDEADGQLVLIVLDSDFGFLFSEQ